MKILILSASPESYATKRLAEECTAKNVESEIINPSDLYAYVSSTTAGHDRIYQRGEEKSKRIKAKSFDAIIPRVSGKGFDHGAMIVKHLTSNLHTFSTGYEPGLRACSNKFLTAQILSQAHIRNPKQILAHQPSDYSELIEMLGDFPVIGKLQRGSLGQGVFILNDALSASTSLNSFQTLGANVILQQKIDSGTPANDIRIIVIGPETKNVKIHAYKRFSLDSDFRSNYSLSGKGIKVEITDEERQMAIDAALAIGIGVSGVDIIRDINDNNKPYIIEINSTPGLSGVESITGNNVAGDIIQYCIDNYKRKEMLPGGHGTWAKVDKKGMATNNISVSQDEANTFFRKYSSIVRHLQKGGDVKLLSHSYRNQVRTIVTKEQIVKGYPK